MGISQLLTHGEVMTAVRLAHRVARATYLFRVNAVVVVLPDHLHAVWSLPSRTLTIYRLLRSLIFGSQRR
ncbi:MAG: hypothetical protein ACREX3_08955 [Gammaproteobacteria bacterium]